MLKSLAQLYTFITMPFLHSLRVSGSITTQEVLGISIVDMEDNAFRVTLSTDGLSPMVECRY